MEQRYEHDFLTVQNDAEVKQALAKREKDGWELASCYINGHGWRILIFKRPAARTGMDETGSKVPIRGSDKDFGV